MSATIFKEVITDLQEQGGYIEGYAVLPADAIILKIDTQRRYGEEDWEICVWFITMPSEKAPKGPKKFVIVPTGGIIPADISFGDYWNTVFMDSLVWHVFAVTVF